MILEQCVLEALLEIRNALWHQDRDTLCEKHSCGAGGDISMGADLLAESIFIQCLKPFGSIDSEESGFVAGHGDLIFCLDPLDGSENFFSGFPYYGTSLAAQTQDGTTVLAIIANFATSDVILKNPTHTIHGKIGEPLSRFKPLLPQKNRVGMGIFEQSYKHPKLVECLREANLKFRSPGALALSLSHAHHIDFVLFGGKARAYDIQAGLYLCGDFHTIVRDDFLLISRDIELFEQIHRFL